METHLFGYRGSKPTGRPFEEDMLIAIAANDTSFGPHTTTACPLAGISHLSLHVYEENALPDLVSCEILEFEWLRLLPLSATATTETSLALRAVSQKS